MQQVCGIKPHMEQKKTVVAFGDADLTFNTRGCKPITSSSLLRKMKQRTTVWMTDEFRTSKLCCCCLQPMEGERRINEDGKAVRLFGVRRCANSECGRTLWDRDVNAAISIMRKCRWDLCGEELPKEFRRKKDGALSSRCTLKKRMMIVDV